VLTPSLQFLLAAMAGWVNRSQQDVIDYLQAENRILREHLSAAGDCDCPTLSEAFWLRPPSG
jgi:hypothetical protein